MKRFNISERRVRFTLGGRILADAKRVGPSDLLGPWLWKRPAHGWDNAHKAATLVECIEAIELNYGRASYDARTRIRSKLRGRFY